MLGHTDLQRACPVDVRSASRSSAYLVSRGFLSFQGNYLLSGSSDKSAIVWDVARGDVQQQFRFHEAPTLVRIHLERVILHVPGVVLSLSFSAVAKIVRW